MINVFDWEFESSPGPEVTAYTTTWNCIAGGYPIRASINSFLWADSIVVVDGGSTDGTRELLAEIEKENPKVKVFEIPIDLNLPGKDGNQKAMSLAMCATPIAIQFDIDEVCIGEVSQWRRLIKDLPANVNILNLPVIEPIGDINKIRVNAEHTPWKWRIIRTKPEITHGIPKQDQLVVDGRKHSKGGSDGCFLMHIVTEETINSKMSPDAKQITELKGANSRYVEFLENLLSENRPAILHLGHVDLVKKIEHYLSSWHIWWCHLYNKDPADPKNNIYFSGVLPSNVTREMVLAKVAEIKKNTPAVDVRWTPHEKT